MRAGDIFYDNLRNEFCVLVYFSIVAYTAAAGESRVMIWAQALLDLYNNALKSPLLMAPYFCIIKIANIDSFHAVMLFDSKLPAMYFDTYDHLISDLNSVSNNQIHMQYQSDLVGLSIDRLCWLIFNGMTNILQAARMNCCNIAWFWTWNLSRGDQTPMSLNNSNFI